MDLLLTDHAAKRMSQRGAPPAAVQVVVQFGDRRICVGAGCVSVSMSRNMACELAKGGEISPSMVDRLANLYVVVANDNDLVVTVVRPNNRKAARSYAKPHGYHPRSRNRDHR